MLTPHLVDGRVGSVSVVASYAVHSGFLAIATTSKDEIGAPNVTSEQSLTNGQLLHGPPVAVRIAEKDE